MFPFHLKLGISICEHKACNNAYKFYKGIVSEIKSSITRKLCYFMRVSFLVIFVVGKSAIHLKS